MKKTVAIFVDAGFFIRLFTTKIDPDMKLTPEKLAKEMWRYWIRHVDRKNNEVLYRIYFYDCPPLQNIAKHPITDKDINFARSHITEYKTRLHQALIRQPYVACRMGHLAVDTKTDWGFGRTDKIHSFKKLIRGQSDPAKIDPNNVILKPKQKGVDMKLGIDITSVVLKGFANKIILISGDSDFVPAAKLTRTEGAHFILDAMGREVKGGLAEHIDGLKTFIHSHKCEE
ncbi:MAG: NYN domain-containing protein [Gammaproteobacteria bacterium]|nr:MAG: NYN domain-containing protein [Gammaproteobacteria bacterium]